MRTLLALTLAAAPLAAQDTPVVRPTIAPPPTVVPPPRAPAPPAVEMSAAQRPVSAAGQMTAAERSGSVTRAQASHPTPNIDGPSFELTQAGRAAARETLRIDTIDGRIWARGRDYKATIGTDGLTFIPFLGSDAPQNYPVTFALDSLFADGVEAALVHSAAATQAGARVVIDRGIVDEVYEPTLAGVEQSFVIERRPSQGECVLRVSARGDLSADGEGGAIRFVNERGGVSYGAAFAVNADGSKTALQTTLVDGTIEIRLDAALLENASYPLVVDPIITTFALPAGTFGLQPTFGIDVAYDASTNRALYVTEEIFSATDHDALGSLVDGSGAFIASNYYDYTSDDWVGIKAATYANFDQFLTVASVRVGVSGVRKIRGVLTRPLTTISWGTPFDVATSTDALINPDVGGDPYPGTSYFCVVWERVRSVTDHDIEYCTVDGFGVLSNVGAVLDNSTGTYDSFPRISKSNMTSYWNIVWQRGVPSGDHDVYGASLNYFGASVLPSHGILVFSFFDDTYPVVTGNLHTGERQVVNLWNSGGNNALFSVMVTGTTPGVGVTIPQTALNQQTALAIDTDGKRVFVTFADAVTPTNAEAKLVELQRVDGVWQAVRSDILISDSGTTSAIGGTCITSKYAGDGSGGAVCGSIDVNGGATPVPLGALYTLAPFGAGGNFEFVSPTCLGYGPGATPCPCGNNGASGGGCGSSVISIGAILYGFGDASLAADGFLLNGADMPNGGTLYFQGTALQAGGAGIVFGDGLLCLGGTITRLGVKINVAGQSTFPGPGDPSISFQGGITEPGTRYYQAWYRDAAAFCTGATYNLTNALKVTWLW